jgi:hypothetical protein
VIAIRIVELADGSETPFDGQYVMEYDPNRDGQDPDGNPMLAHLVTTPVANDAMRFDGLRELRQLWLAVDQRRPVRPDGQPNRPLTAFTVEFVRVG